MAARMDFATLTPADARTSRALAAVLDAEGRLSLHHRQFIRRDAAALTAQIVTRRDDNVSIPKRSFSSSGATTEADLSSDNDDPAEDQGCYVLAFVIDHMPVLPHAGWQVGTGNFHEDILTGRVDLLLSPPSASVFVSQRRSHRLYPRHCSFVFDSSGRLCLEPRHNGVRLNGEIIPKPAHRILGPREIITIGAYCYIFAFNVLDEERLQAMKARYLRQYVTTEPPHELVSATPSTNDVHIDDWVLHGIVGKTPVSVIQAASHRRTGELVAVKRLLRDSQAPERTDKELQTYRDLSNALATSRSPSYVMKMHSVLMHQPLGDQRAQEMYMLWTPLARGDFARFHRTGAWRQSTTHSVMLQLFYQAVLGVEALHVAGWIHRDLKPANIGVVSRGEQPRAVILDLAQAVPTRTEGFAPRLKHCGTVGFLAPELENSQYASTYGQPVDMWSLGAVAYFLFDGQGQIPWGCRWNMFVPELNAIEPTLDVFRSRYALLKEQPANSLGSLIAWMLEEEPGRRATTQDVLGHSALRDALSFHGV